jgi:DNA repair exonuclease SbcCD ATPase subunit
MDNIEQKLREELERFKQIGHNATNLNEQFIGDGSGFVNQQGNSPRVSEFIKRQKELEEQEEEEVTLEADPEVDTEELPAEEEGLEAPVDTEDELVGDEEDLEGEEEIETEDSTELDVTDLVSSQEEIEKEVATTKDEVEDNNEKLESLLSKLDDLEDQLSSMDKLVKQIDSIEDKIEKYRPKTSEEKMELRKQHDSGPFSKTLEDFWTDEQDKYKKTGKVDYILTPKDVENYNESDVKQSFSVENKDDN